jgi:hypothetical protein
MAVRICCANNHATKAVSTWEAAVALSAGKPIGVCKKCGKELQYRIDRDATKNQNRFVVTKAIRLGIQMHGGESFDPFLLVLRDMEGGAEQVLPTYWTSGRDAAPRGGQFPPSLALEDWKTLFRRLDAEFDAIEDRIRLRAYEIYEQRGKTPGHAIDDWLQAEAELTDWRRLRAAA